MNDGEVIIGVGLEDKSFDQQIKETEKKLQELEKRFEETKNMKPYKGQEEDLKELGLEIEKTKNKLVDLNKRQADLNKVDLQKAESSFSNIGASIGKIIKKTAVWALAIFGIRSAYSAVQKAVGILSQYDTQLATDIEYIQFALASTLKPIIEWLVKAIYQILGYVGSLIHSITGINIFANATAKAFNKSTKEAKKLKKELTGIDKINKLASGDTGGAGGTKTPGLDLSKINTKINLDSAMQSINNFIDKAKELFNKGFDTIKKNIMKVLLDLGFSKQFVAFFGTMLDGVKMQINGLLDVIKGVLNIIVGLVSGDTKRVKEGINTLIKGLKQIITGAITNLIGQLGMIGTVIWDLFGKIIDTIGKFTKPIGKKLGEIGKSIVTTITNVIKGIPDLFTNTFNKIKGFFVNVGTKAGDLIGGAFKKAINLALEAVEDILNTGIKAINKLKSSLGALSLGIPKLETINIPKLAKGGIVNQPGRGVMVGSAIAGEKGAEWVQPLTDEQSLSRIGQAIGRHVKVSVDFTALMDSRQVARVLKDVNNEKKFALNGG